MIQNIFNQFCKISCPIFALTLVFFSVLGPKTVAQADNSVAWHQDEIIINEPVENILKIIGDYDKYDKWFPYIVKSRTLYKKGYKASAYFESKILNTFFWMRINIDHKTWANVNQITARLVKGNISSFDVDAKIYKINKNTSRIVLRMKGDPGITGVPNSLVNDYNKKVVREALIKLRARLLLGNY